MSLDQPSAPPRDAKRWRFYCSGCERHGVMAGFRFLFSGEDVPPDQLHCPDCGIPVEILGRDDN